MINTKINFHLPQYFSVVFADPCEQGSFWQCCRLDTKKNFSYFST